MLSCAIFTQDCEQNIICSQLFAGHTVDCKEGNHSGYEPLNTEMNYCELMIKC